MNKIFKYFTALLLTGILITPFGQATAGNKDRTGQAGASELLINPWARSSGWGGVNNSSVKGLEGLFSNVAGTAHTKGTELIFSHTQWLKGSEIGINTFGLTQKIGKGGVIGLGIMSMSFGDIPITTEDLPEGGIGNFSPTYMNINISYAKAFSSSIYGGINIKIISEVISDVSAQGIALDAGIQYVTGPRENVRFGITLRNVGPTMRFNGDGLSIRSLLPGQESYFTLEQRSADFELPTQLAIGASYDFKIGEIHRLTLAGNFISNSFTKDQYVIGAEYELKTYLMLRGGYSYEEGITNDADRTTAYTGPSAGFTVAVPLDKEKGSNIAIDYSYRATDPFSGTHSIGARINL
ncbi:MAG: PorV/PorQ family protein [Bacteroidales bacterium]|nr:PorV/PorQ family protein [Bacteroidales bacterium]